MIVYSEYKDEELVGFLYSDDKLAFNEIYQRYWKKSYNEAYKRLRNVQLTEEVVQNVFADLWVRRGRVIVGSLPAYLTVAVRNQVYAQYKKSSRLPIFEEPLEHMAENHLQADSLFQLKELKLRIEDWLSHQPEKRREIFRMRFMQELSTKEISEILGVSQNTVQNQLSTATKNLKDNLGYDLMISIIILALKS